MEEESFALISRGLLDCVEKYRTVFTRANAKQQLSKTQYAEALEAFRLFATVPEAAYVTLKDTKEYSRQIVRLGGK